ncbi:MAG: ABC transporter ATP-binding protein, partial [Chloroflexi bacterium]
MSKKENKSSSDQLSIGRMLRIISRFWRGQAHLFGMAGVMLILEAATAVLVPLVMAYVFYYLAVRLQQINGVAVEPPQSPLGYIGLPPVINSDIDMLVITTVGIVLLTMVNSLCDSLAEIYLARGGRSLGYNLRVSLYSHLQKLSLAFHDNRRTGDIITRVTSDVAALEDFIVSDLSDFVGSLLAIVFILAAILTRAWEVALVAAVIIPVMALVSNYFTQRIKAASKKRRTSEGELASAATEMLASIRVIQTYGQGSYEQSLFAEQSHKAMDAALEAAAYQARFSWVVSVLGAVSIAAVIWMSVFLIFRDPTSVAQVALLTAYTKFIADMFKPTKRIIQQWNTFGKLYASIERVGDLMDLQPSVRDEPGAVPAPQLRGRVEFRDVSFHYPGSPPDADGKSRGGIRNLNFNIEPGQIVAVVGHTGAGKSTLVQLIPRLYDPTGGEVMIDGRNIKEFTLDTLRAQISMVLQESILFSGSVVENIAYGRPDASGAEIIAASKQANAHEFIEKFPEGYYTMLGERGSNLSGGQRQRIAIARAFIRNTPILVMDEPTTGLDAESTDLVLRALRKLMQGKTTIIISHDLNLIRDANKIIVIKAGEIEQIGTHTELLQAGGLYASLYTKQYGSAEITKARREPAGLLAGAIPVSGKGTESLEEVMTVQALLDKLDYDLPHSAPFVQRLPALNEAFDAEKMKALLHQILFNG